MDLAVDASINLSVWLEAGNPELMDADWEHVRSEVRADEAILDQGGEGPEDADAFEVEGAVVRFAVQ